MTTFAAFSDWALRGLVAGCCVYVMQQIHHHSQQLNEIQSAIIPMQYDLKSLTEKGAEQRQQLRNLETEFRDNEKREYERWKSKE